MKIKLLTCNRKPICSFLPPHEKLPTHKRINGCYCLPLKILQDYKAQPQEQLLSEQLVEAYATSENNPKYYTGCTCSKVYVYIIIAENSVDLLFI
jgi:hypothetical protein